MEKMVLKFEKMVLKFNGKIMPTPKFDGFKISKNKIWSRNAGRNSNGDMVGTIVTIKRKVEIAWPPLNTKEVALIDDEVSNAVNSYVPISYTDESGNTTEMTVYFGDVTYPILGYINGQQIVNGVGISGIEQ